MTNFTRKHWIVLIICLLGTFIYSLEYYLLCNSQGNCFSSQKSSIVLSISRTEVLEVDKRGYYFKACNCTKHQNYLRRLVNQTLVSTCSEESDWYGHGQRVVSFTLYNGVKIANDGRKDYFKMFSDGISPNIKQMRKLYPGWIMRIYSNCKLTKKFCRFACKDDIMWCDVRSSRFKFNRLENVNPRIWRFMPLGDPTVDIFVSRDLDSLIVEREREVVDEWLNSSFAIHCARDGTNSKREMPAGIWGAKNSELDVKEMASVRDKMIAKGVNKFKARLDENLLRKYIFYKYNYTMLCHDSYSCKKYSVPSVPYPKQRKNRTRVALEIRILKKFQPKPCPVECRPSYGKNWTYC